MVNTFLTCADYEESARSLNYRNHTNAAGRHGGRLWKQVLEAQQIIRVISDLEILENYYTIPLPKDKSKHKQWVRDLKKRYFEEDFVFVVTDILTKVPKPKLPTRKQQIDKVKTSTRGHVINLGWCHHSVVHQWLGYLDSLKEYHDAHLKVWLERGYKTKNIPYGIKNARRPPWTKSENTWKNHRAALLNKEITRVEDPWYSKMIEFTSAGHFTGYIYE